MLISIQNRESFISKFLTPITKLSESACISVHPDKITSLTTNSDNSLILHVTHTQPSTVTDKVILNVPNISRFVNLFSCITSDESDLDFNENCVVCKAGDLKFKYHLLEDGILKVPSINIQKIKDLKFDTTFYLQKDNILQLLKASTFTTDTDKLYISTDDTKVYGELTDKQQANVDSFKQPISMSYDGLSIPTPISINFELIRVIGSLRLNRECKTVVHINNENKVFIFDITCGDNKLQYITSAYAE
mgnify:CR=1 FL=1